MNCDENPEIEVEVSYAWGPWFLGPHCLSNLIQKCSYSIMKNCVVSHLAGRANGLRNHPSAVGTATAAVSLHAVYQQWH
jgi:hypothetical protein